MLTQRGGVLKDGGAVILARVSGGTLGDTAVIQQRVCGVNGGGGVTTAMARWGCRRGRG